MPLVQPGQFVVGHLPCHATNIKDLSGFRVLFTYRNLRDAMVSYMRYVTKNWRSAGGAVNWADVPDGPAKMERFFAAHPYFLPMCQGMIAWKDPPGVLACAYEDFIGDRGPLVQRECLEALVRFTGLPSPHDAEQLLREVIGRETLTSSGARTDPSQWWSSGVEQVFRNGGGVELNRRLGYAEQ